jgi:thiol:disulfide interchange protein/DsbC/DsbD-like thiol-disulfide interchange protein
MASSMKRLLMFLLVLLLPVSAADAQSLAPGEKAMRVSLVAEGSAIPGEKLAVAFRMQPKPGWHGYWKNPGDAGYPTGVAWALPPGVTAGELQYPVPTRLKIGDLMNYVYDGEYGLLTELDIPASARIGSILPVSAKLDYLVCTDKVCVPESATVATQLRVAGVATAANRPLFDRYRQAIPLAITGSTFEVAGNRVRFAVTIPDFAVSDPYFYPETEDIIAYAAPQRFSRVGDEIIMEFAAAPRVKVPAKLKGVFQFAKGQGLALTGLLGNVPAAGAPLEVVPQDGESTGIEAGSFLLILAGAVLGGLLLNIMPCVFPILSLKALSLAKIGGDEGAARREAIAYSAGVISTCLALGAALLALRAGGAAVGWAFQLQDPRIILILFLLVVAIALNLAGLFELPAITGGGTLARKGGVGGAFWTGVLAAFVATPCTGPFMATALGAALVLPAAYALAIFAGLGVGIALPFILVGFGPALRRRLPKPGPWMDRFRRLLSIPMFLTALALAWILGRQAGVDGMTLGLAAGMMFGLTLWWVGRRQGRERAWLPLLPVSLAVVLAVATLPTTTVQPDVRPARLLNAEPFSEARLAELRSDGRRVFVYFTADWCINCKVNERGALRSKAVARAFKRRDVAVLVGDLTRPNPAYMRFIQSHDRPGVPLYLYYAPGRPAEKLPQVLTVSRLTGLS